MTPDKVQIDDKGLAQTTIVAGDNALDNNGIVVVEASLLDAPQVTSPPVLIFTARFLNAACVYVGPDVCPPGQKATKSNTVASLISFLCESGGGGKRPGFAIKDVLRFKAANSPDFDAPVTAFEQIAAALLENGVLFETEADIDPECAKRGEVGYLLVDIPFAVVMADIMAFWGNDARMPPFGAQPTKLEGEIQVSRRQGPSGLVWKPSRNTMNWFKKAPSVFARMELQFALSAELVLMGSRIYDKSAPRRYLDGELYLDGKEARGARYPSGDGNGGGDFRLPFTIV